MSPGRSLKYCAYGSDHPLKRVSEVWGRGGERGGGERRGREKERRGKKRKDKRKRVSEVRKKRVTKREGEQRTQLYLCELWLGLTREEREEEERQEEEQGVVTPIGAILKAATGDTTKSPGHGGFFSSVTESQRFSR